MGCRAVLLVTVSASLCLNAETLPIRSFTAGDGLATEQVNCIVPDSRGFIWFCTPEGLSRFDGYRIVSFGTAEGLPSRVVESFLETRSGVYLVGTSRGLCRFNPAAGGNKFTTYLPGHTRFQNHITSLLETPSGRIWCGTFNGLYELRGDFAFRQQPLTMAPTWDRVTVSDLLESPDHKLWVATPTGIDVIGTDRAIQHIGKHDGLPNDWVNALLRDSQGRLWAGTRGGLVLLRDGSRLGHCGILQVYAAKEGLLGVTSLAQGFDGSVWIGMESGLSRLLPSTARPTFQRFTRVNGLSDRQVNSLAADPAGNIWAGTEGAGVMRIESAGFTTFREQDGLASDRVSALLQDRGGKLLAVTTNEASKSLVSFFDGAKFHSFPLAVFTNNSPWGHHILLQSHTGEWWAATKTGLCRYPPVKAAGLAYTRPQACYAPDVQVFQIFEDSRGAIWASAQSKTGDQLLRWDPRRQAVSRLADGPCHSPLLVSAFAEDQQGNIWMGLWLGGELYRFDGRRFTRFASAEGVPEGVVFAMLTDHAGRVWIGSSSGLAVIEHPAAAPFRVRQYHRGLAGNSVESLVEDNAGRIYAGGQLGVDRLDPVTGHIKHFSAADGLAHGPPSSALRDASGNLWFATTQGLSRLTPVADRPPTIPSVLVTELQAGRDRYPVSQAGERVISRIELQPSFNQLQVRFVGFNNEPEERLLYSYELEGAAAGWQTPARAHELNFPGLPSGSYRLLVKAVNSEGQESASPAEVDFTVLPPFWRRWWFETLALAALAGLVVALHRYRVAQAVSLERMRTAIATDLHDDIGASLSQIAILSEVARMDQNGGPAQPNDRLERVATLARELADSMSDIVWSIRAEPEGVDALMRRMREFAIDLLESQAIAFELRAPQSGSLHVQLSLQARRQLFLIFKECIHNSARHSRCTAVVAEFQVAAGEAVLRVSDNGRGISAKSPRGNGGNGMPNMRRRAEDLGGRITWTSIPGPGCTVEVRLPLRHAAFRRAGL